MASILPSILLFCLSFLYPLVSSTLQNSTVDDESTSITYTPASAWTNGGQFPEFDNTTHTSYASGGTAEFSFTGSAIYYFAASNTDHGAAAINLDGDVTLINSSSTVLEFTVLQWSATNLDDTVPHFLTITNCGTGATATDVDEIIYTYDDSLPTTASIPTFTAPVGTIQNFTVDDVDPSITYVGAGWTQSGQTEEFNSTTHTSYGAGNSATLRFNGTAIYYFAASNTDHGNFTVNLDGAVTLLNSEGNLTFQVLQFSRTGLSDTREHYITVTNAGGGATAMDVDYFIYTSVDSSSSSSSSTSSSATSASVTSNHADTSSSSTASSATLTATSSGNNTITGGSGTQSDNGSGSSSSSSSSSNTGAIVGGVVGGAAVIAAAVLGFMFLRRRNSDRIQTFRGFDLEKSDWGVHKQTPPIPSPNASYPSYHDPTQTNQSSSYPMPMRESVYGAAISQEMPSSQNNLIAPNTGDRYVTINTARYPEL